MPLASLTDIKSRVGQEVGVSSWIEIGQARMGAEARLFPDGMKMAINYGLDRVRFLAPVRSGKRVRGRFTLDSVEEKAAGQILLKHTVTVEIGGESKPALTAVWLTLLFV